MGKKQQRYIARTVYEINKKFTASHILGKRITHQHLVAPDNTTRKLMKLEQGNYYDSHSIKKKKCNLSWVKNNGSFADKLTKENIKAVLL